MTNAKTEPKATMVAKVIRADGTEETFVSTDLSVTDAKAAEKLLAQFAKENSQ